MSVLFTVLAFSGDSYDYFYIIVCFLHYVYKAYVVHNK